MGPRAVALAIGALVAISVAVTGASADAAGPAPARLQAFDSCRSFAAYMAGHAAPLVGRPRVDALIGAQPGAANGMVSGSRGVAVPEFSGTNVQEDGVDEPDTVKTDGRYLYIASSGRISALDVRSGRPRLVGTLRLEPAPTYEILLHDDRLLALSRRAGDPVPLPGRTGGIRPLPVPVSSAMTEIDISSPARMRLVRTMELNGAYVTARLVGSTVRVVVSSQPTTELPLLPIDAPGPGAADKVADRNRDIVRAVGANSWLPRYTLRNARGKVTRTGRLVGCRDVLRPRSFSGLGLVTVLTVDLERGLQPRDSDALAGDAQVVYASPSSLYVASTEQEPTGNWLVAPSGTTIHKFDISSPSETRYRASGRVPGVLLDQWSLSERNGILRVASTSVPVSTGGPATEAESSMRTFAERDGSLVALGRVGGLGRGERVYAVRFVGDIGYVVTFRQVDPLYTVDLSVPSRPTVRGELKIRGYSAYLHPVGDGLLLGVGQDATDDGRTLGTLASLFDVSDPARPKRLDAFTLGRTRSQAEDDHHAFLWWPRTRLAVIPVQTHLDTPFLGALGLRISRSGISEVGRVVHPGGPGVEPTGSPGTPISRSLVVGDTLFTVSAVGVRGSALGTFADRGFVKLPFDEPEPLPGPTTPRR